MEREVIVGATLAAVEEIFGMMVGLPAVPGRAYLEEPSPAESEGLVTLIGLVGSWIGAGSICCSMELACKLSSALLMEDLPSFNREVLDALAEITNMVFGNVKTTLEGRLGPLGLSIPTVIFGRNFSTNSAGQNVWHVVPFRVESEIMKVKICLGPKDETGNSRPAAPHVSPRY